MSTHPEGSHPPAPDQSQGAHSSSASTLATSASASSGSSASQRPISTDTISASPSLSASGLQSDQSALKQEEEDDPSNGLCQPAFDLEPNERDAATEAEEDSEVESNVDEIDPTADGVEDDEDEQVSEQESPGTKTGNRLSTSKDPENTRKESTSDNVVIMKEEPLSSDDDNDNEDEATSMLIAHDDEDSHLPNETVCRWKDCGKVLPSLATLVVHLSDEHIGWKKAAYTCEWEGCSRRPIAQTTRFALISHMRSHTKHKPYDCPVPECDKSFSRSDAMAKHLKCQHGDVPERFTGRKSRGRYTMKDPAASSTLLHDSTFGARKRRHHESRSDAEHSSSYLPTKLRKLGSGVGKDDCGAHNNRRDNTEYHRKFTQTLLQAHMNSGSQGTSNRARAPGLHAFAGTNGYKTTNGHHHNGNDHDRETPRKRSTTNNSNDNDDDAEDSDFAVDHGQSPKQQYKILKAKFRYIFNERESLEAEYEEMKKKLLRLRVERELLLDALLESQQQYQDPALQRIEDSE
ncbi:hypothetical protein BGW38_007726 [Lunasporangiospora selenospora]|uniref:C2H2-type domain-containing protein n=1 Tax=Lunasporangiospora selenospora TaxID=979761 RepID=A0A9P6FY71_9FUNG|nr:hypothetical protein BGW38_007726 [Lunasporangiospora selenospora]